MAPLCRQEAPHGLEGKDGTSFVKWLVSRRGSQEEGMPAFPGTLLPEPQFPHTAITMGVK